MCASWCAGVPGETFGCDVLPEGHIEIVPICAFPVLDIRLHQKRIAQAIFTKEAMEGIAQGHGAPALEPVEGHRLCGRHVDELLIEIEPPWNGLHDLVFSHPCMKAEHEDQLHCFVLAFVDEVVALLP